MSRSLLGHAFHNNTFNDSADDIWSTYARSFGLVRQLAQSLTPDGVQRLKRDVDITTHTTRFRPVCT